MFSKAHVFFKSYVVMIRALKVNVYLVSSFLASSLETKACRHWYT